MVHKAFLLGFLALVSPLLVSSATLPSVVKSIHNCSSEAPPVPITYKPYFSSYGPQVSGSHGWEEWTFVLPDQLNQSMFHFRWTRGNPAASVSDLDAATFSAYYQKTGFRADVKGSFESKTIGDTYLSMSIGDNYLSFNGSAGGLFGLWNVSVDIEGLKVDVVVDPVTPSVPFDPSLNGKVGVLVSGYRVSHPVYRGHTNGVATLPSGQTWGTQQVATLKHAYAHSSVQSLLSTYTRVSTFIGPNTLNWYTAKALKGSITTAAQFVYGSLDLSKIVPVYQVTNEPSILEITSSISSTSHNYTATFAGCKDTLDHPFTFNSTSGVYLGAITDSAGGKTQYWDVTTQALFYVDGQPWSNDATVGSLGLLEIYASP